VNPYADYLEATCTEIDATNKVITCQSVICEGSVCDIEEFALPFDHLLIAVGAATNTYGIPVRSLKMGGKAGQGRERGWRVAMCGGDGKKTD
jgi:NADH dehydrogenase FAD-containing subunit